MQRPPGLSTIVGGNVKRLRLARNMTQAELAQAAGTAQNVISGMESGMKGASMLMLGRVAEALGVKGAELFKERGTK